MLNFMVTLLMQLKPLAKVHSADLLVGNQHSKNFLKDCVPCPHFYMHVLFLYTFQLNFYSGPVHRLFSHQKILRKTLQQMDTQTSQVRASAQGPGIGLIFANDRMWRLFEGPWFLSFTLTEAKGFCLRADISLPKLCSKITQIGMG